MTTLTLEQFHTKVREAKALTPPAGTELETRCVRGLEVRDADQKKFPGSIGTVVGYAAKFNSPSRDFGGFRETISKGAFTRSLQMNDDMHDVRALMGHDKTRVLGRRSAGTLEIREDDIGLPVAIHLIDTTDGQDTLKNVRAGNLDAMSFGFPKAKAMWKGGATNMTRELSDIELREVSVVSWAMYENTELSVRDLTTFAGELPEVCVGAPVSVLKMQRQALELRFNHEHGKGGLFASTSAASDHAETKTTEADKVKTDLHATQAKAHHDAADAHQHASNAHHYAANQSSNQETKSAHFKESEYHQQASEMHRSTAYAHQKRAAFIDRKKGRG